MLNNNMSSNTNGFQLSPNSLKALREWDEAHKEEHERRKVEAERGKAEKAGKKPEITIFDEIDEYYEMYGFDGIYEEWLIWQMFKNAR